MIELSAPEVVTALLLAVVAGSVVAPSVGAMLSSLVVISAKFVFATKSVAEVGVGSSVVDDCAASVVVSVAIELNSAAEENSVVELAKAAVEEVTSLLEVTDVGCTAASLLETAAVSAASDDDTSAEVVDADTIVGELEIAVVSDGVLDASSGGKAVLTVPASNTEDGLVVTSSEVVVGTDIAEIVDAELSNTDEVALKYASDDASEVVGCSEEVVASDCLENSVELLPVVGGAVGAFCELDGTGMSADDVLGMLESDTAELVSNALTAND